MSTNVPRPPPAGSVKPAPPPAPPNRRGVFDAGPIQSRAATISRIEDLYVQFDGADLSSEDNVRHALQAVLAHIWMLRQELLP